MHIFSSSTKEVFQLHFFPALVTKQTNRNFERVAKSATFYGRRGDGNCARAGGAATKKLSKTDSTDPGAIRTYPQNVFSTSRTKAMANFRLSVFDFLRKNY